MKFSEKRFVDIGQKLYIRWLRKIAFSADINEEQFRVLFGKAAKIAFIAAEEFAKVFDGQEDVK